ncbi:hypothetical protein TNCT_387371 [Trichonephila clavata]|uniref:Uncharacterized protein n=1 Tax=Trichonephila clavata TaxID=2740835 RepID=A0A8X6L0V9_TRICU|nr:hypothetical protein TNCT_387371 [Trichonephila clavata]
MQLRGTNTLESTGNRKIGQKSKVGRCKAEIETCEIIQSHKSLSQFVNAIELDSQSLLERFSRALMQSHFRLGTQIRKTSLWARRFPEKRTCSRACCCLQTDIVLFVTTFREKKAGVLCNRFVTCYGSCQNGNDCGEHSVSLRRKIKPDT